MEPLEVLTLIIAGSTAVIMTVALAAYARRRHLDRRPRVVNSRKRSA